MKDKMSIIPMVVFLSVTFIISVFAFLWGMKVFSPIEIRKAALPKEHPDPLREALGKATNGLNNLELVGKQHYEVYCMVCHGERGAGDGFNAFNLDPRPADLAIVRKKGDEHLFQVISKGSVSVKGSPLCPPWGATLDEDRIRSIVAYLHTLGS
ncbi:MAG TPA: c-type cytochrome [Candidatus Hypogeohydataceae bacterium YC41]